MRVITKSLTSVLTLLAGLTSTLAQGRESILTVIPSDAVGFAVIHNLKDTSQSIDQVSSLVQAPPLNLLGLVKNITGVQKGLDEEGDMAVVLTSIDPAPKRVAMIPVANSADFFEALHAEEPTTDVVDVQLAGRQLVAGYKDGYALFSLATDQDALERFLDSTTSLANEPSLVKWLASNKLSVVVTSYGVEKLIPRITDGIHSAQAGLRQSGNEQGKAAAEMLNIYLKFFSAAENEIDQIDFGLRIDSSQTVSLVKRVQFKPEGKWAHWAAKAMSETGNPLAGLQGGQFILAAGGIIPPGASEELMELSVDMMQYQPQFKLTPEQARKYVEITKGMMGGVHSMGMLMGVAEPGAGLYGNTSAVITVDDSKDFMDNYQKALAESREFAQEIKVPGIPVTTSQRITLGDTEALEVTMDMAQMTQMKTPGGPDPQKMMELFVGKGDKMKIYIAPADEHTVIMAYTSLERLKTALTFYKSKQPGLSADPNVAKVAAALPPGSQFVMYVSLDGTIQLAQQFASMVPGGNVASIPDFPKSPPLGFAVKISGSEAEGHMVVMPATLKAIGSVVAKARGAAHGAGPPQQ